MKKFVLNVSNSMLTEFKAQVNSNDGSLPPHYRN